MTTKSKGMVVAIDGPAGSGKSTVTHLVARKLGYVHIDTGALYRAVALKAEEGGIGIENGAALGKLAAGARIEFQWLNDERNHVFLDGKNVSDRIRTPEMSMDASRASAHPEVRQALLELQRTLGRQAAAEAGGGAVLEGRDIGTVVFPDADIKFFLTASVDSRARRRMVELEGRGIYLDFAEVRKQVVERDRGDTERKAAPLRKADDAIEVDTTNMTVEEVVERLASEVEKRRRELGKG